MDHINSTLTNISWQLRLNALIKALLLTAIVCLLLIMIAPPSWVMAGVGAVTFFGFSFAFGVFKNRYAEAIHLLHKSSNSVEFSLGLINKSQLTIAEQLQLERLRQSADITPPIILHQKILPFILGLLIAVTVYFLIPFMPTSYTSDPQLEPQVGISPMVSETEAEAPKMTRSEVFIQPPAYTGLKSDHSEDLNISAIIGSKLTWTISFDQSLKVKLIDLSGKEIVFQNKNGAHVHTDKVMSSGVYVIKAYRDEEEVYKSPFYKLEGIQDRPPVIEPLQEELYTYHFLKDEKKIKLEAKVSDDFLVTDAYIVATVARGSGENVKFRETRLTFDKRNFKNTTLSKEIDLNKIEMKPGDELYYYWAALDNRQPEPNFSRSETYFIKYQDTTKMSEGELTTMAIQVMPEYFRSQRQIIIDTEKLLAEKSGKPKKKFNETSNEIGYDQKLLRMRYGQYLGEEFESSAGGGNPMADGGENLLESFMHLHDQEGEHDHGDHGHEHDHGHGHEPKGRSDDGGLSELLEQYLHSHDDGEVNTYYEESTRTLLKMALEQMWKSELHLRLFEPEKALPFQNKALEYLKTVQQKSRAYVKKTGFDPPPIREEEKRLSGELKDVAASAMKRLDFDKMEFQVLVAKVLGIIEKGEASPAEQEIIKELGSIWTERMKYSGMQDWSTLIDLQKLASGDRIDAAIQAKMKAKLLPLTANRQNRGSSYATHSELEKHFWKNIR